MLKVSRDCGCDNMYKDIPVVQFHHGVLDLYRLECAQTLTERCLLLSSFLQMTLPTQCQNNRVGFE